MAAKVKGHTNMESFFQNRTRVGRLVDTIHPGRGLTIDDVKHCQTVEDYNSTQNERAEKRAKRYVDDRNRLAEGKRIKKMHPEVMSTCTVGLRPTKEQKIVLERMLRVANTTYNW